MEACLIVTYRCNARCRMCSTWRHPSKPSEEFGPELLSRLPDGLRFINVTGGEPFVRPDIQELVQAALAKSRRVVVSTNGYFTDRILALAERFGPGVGVRVSLEGLPAANDELRGLEHGFDHGLRTILGLKALGLTDIGFGITVSDRNAADMDSLYELAGSMGLEFATAVTHNSFYFHKADNVLADPEAVAAAFEALARRMLRTGRPKEWFRAWFNMGLANRARGGKRPLPCRAGTDMFFLDPSGDILPCNGSGEPMVMGNLHQEPFDLIWNSERADKIRQAVSACDRQCWMIGTAGPAMKRKIGIPAAWVARNKLRLALDRECALDPVGGAKEGPGRKS